MQRFFREKNACLDVEYRSIHLYQDWMFNEDVKQILKSGYSVMCSFSYAALFGFGDLMIGHMAIIKQIVNNRIQIFDPGLMIMEISLYRQTICFMP